MGKPRVSSNVTEELLRLYELVLSIGKDLDPYKVGRSFLKVIVPRFNLTAASVWWRMDDKAGLMPLASIPRMNADEVEKNKTEIFNDLLNDMAPCIVHSGDKYYAELSKLFDDHERTYAVYPFSGQGVMLLQSASEDGITLRMLNSLRPVMDILGATIQGGVSHQNLMRSEKELKLQRGFLKTLIHTIPDLVWMKGSDGVYLACNERFERFFGASETDIVNKTDYDFVDSELADLFRYHDKQAIEKGSPSVNEEWITFSDDGHKELLETTKTPMYDEKGNVIGVLGVGHDITESRRTQQQLLIERDRSQRYLDTVEAIIVSLDTGGIVTMINRKGCELLGYSDKEIVGKNWFQVFLPQPEGMEQVYPLFKHVIAGQIKSAEYFENEILDSSGNRHLIAWHNAYFHDEDGNVVGTLSAGEDITVRRKAENEIVASRDRLSAIFNATQDAVWLVDKDANLIDVNPAACEALGYEREELIKKRVHDIDTKFDNIMIDKTIEQTMSQGCSRFESQHKRKDGEIIDVEVSISYVPSESIQVSFIRDITEKKRAVEALKQAASVFEHANEGITITDADGTIQEVNKAFSHITGYTREEVIGQNPRLLKSGRHDAIFYEQMWHALKTKKHWTGEIWNRRKNGEIYAEILTISAIADEKGLVDRYVALFADITPIKEQQKQLERMAHYDLLTGMPNRALLADRLRQAMTQAMRHNNLLAVVYLDLDGFKEVNDAHGHDVGDQMLIQLAKRMQDALREGDTLSRLGGDEFVAVLLDLSDHEDCAQILDRLLDATSEPVWIEGLELQISASLGVSFFPQDNQLDPDQLLRQADQAMYQAKQLGKNCYHLFDDEKDKSIRGRHDYVQRIRQALNHDELILHYQPKVNMRTGEVIGTEALVRWQHPERGLLPPGLFLPMIENHILMVELGDWVLNNALQQVETWKRKGLNLPVSVNINALHIQQPDFLQRLFEKLKQFPGVHVGDLELEVLETSALGNLSRVSEIIHACRERGVGFALDDFGTGYSSLTYLKRLSANLLKIDRSFVLNMLEDPDDLAILEGVLGLATAFRREVIAEGVETIEIGEMLLLMGCELGQGYAIARPMQADDVSEWYASWKPDNRWLGKTGVSRDVLPVLFSTVEHRAWFSHLEGYLRGGRKTLPTMDSSRCRFAQWLEKSSKEIYSGLPRLKEIKKLHQEIHQLAELIVEEKIRTGSNSSFSRWNELESMRDELLSHMKQLVQ
ncbi:MAG: PAS domain S-box protein [Candidatus Thiodiazotropha sp. (ex Monitilora ramsayi)]|nr:PAS domain S-box protein [Candidatus Thiodiazotropha sp. (ex Monitilora ramsayi)]